MTGANKNILIKVSKAVLREGRGFMYKYSKELWLNRKAASNEGNKYIHVADSN
jgi:hypothetical protein